MRFHGLLAALAVVLACGGAQAEPLKIRIQHAGAVPGMFGDMLENAAPLGIYKHYGQSYTIESIVMRGTGPALTALAAHELEIAALSYEGVGNAVLNAHLDVKVIGDVLGNGMHGYDADEFIARKGEFKSFKDIKGKVAGINSRGGAPDTALRHMADKNGLKHGEDYTVVELGFPAIIPALESKKIDLGIVVEPFTTLANRAGKFERVFTYTESVGPTESVVWAATGDVIAKNRAALVDFMEDHIRFRHYMFDPANRPAVIAFIAKVTKQPPDLFEGWVFLKNDHYRDPDARVDVPLLQKNMDDAVRLGLLKERVEIVPKYVDMTLIDDALKRMK